MSQRNGDRARFHRERKAKILRRLKIREVRNQPTVPQASAAARSSAAVQPATKA